MKNIVLKILGLAIAIAALAGCSKKGPETVDVSGQWHLVSSDKIDIEEADIDVYISFSAGRFELYQKISGGRYRYFSGNYSVDGSSLSGTYSDGTAWGGQYTVAVSGGTLVMTATNASAEVCTYESTQIPQDIISDSVLFRSSGDDSVTYPWL